MSSRHLSIGLDVWIHDLTWGSSLRITRNPENDENPVWAPNGSRVFFFSAMGGIRNIYSREASGTGAEELVLQSKLSKNVGDVSPDGAWLLFSENKEGRLSIHSLPLKAGLDRKPTPYIVENYSCRFPRFSLDGRFVAYVSDETGRNEVYVETFPRGGGKWPVSIRGGSVPVWARKTGELFYYELESSRLMAVSVAGGAQPRFGKPAPLFETFLTVVATASSYDVTPDGQRFVLAEEPLSRGINLLTRFDDGVR